MTTPKYLALIANEIESLAGFNSSANQTDAGYWERIALAAEQIAGASTSANASELGWMKRASAAIVAKTAFTPSLIYSVGESGYLALMIAALNSSTTQSFSGSQEYQLYQQLLVWTVSAMGGPAPALKFNVASNSQYVPVIAF